MIDQKHSGGFFSGVSSAEQMKQAAAFCRKRNPEAALTPMGNRYSSYRTSDEGLLISSTREPVD